MLSQHVTQILDLPSYSKNVLFILLRLCYLTSEDHPMDHGMAIHTWNCWLLFVVYSYSFVESMFCDRTPSNPQLMSQFMTDCPLFLASVQVSFSPAFILNKW